MTSRRVLIITYYWPPGGGAGVQRWLKFSKYLPAFGWTPVIYTPLNGEMPVTDASLEKDIPEGTEVLRTMIWEPYHVYKKFVGASGNEKINTGFLTERKRPGLAERISVWLRGNLFIPDARKYWIRPSVKYLVSYLEKNPVDAIVSTGPPHSMHRIGLGVARLTGIPWLADFRDPWTRIDYYHDLMLTGYADRKHHRMEHEVVTQASRVVVVGATMKREFEADHGRDVDLITNGYDAADIRQSETVQPDKFILAHIGTLVRSRNPEKLWHVLGRLVAELPGFARDLRIRLTGKVDISVRESIAKAKLDKFVVYTEYLPHDQVISEQQHASVLLLILNNTPNAKGILTGKMFEYLAAGRPVLCVGPPDGDAAAVLRETGAGVVCDFEDENEMERTLAQWYAHFVQGTLKGAGRGVEAYSRKALTEKLVHILNQMITHKQGPIA